MPIMKGNSWIESCILFYIQIYLLYWEFDVYFLNICLLNIICLIIMRSQWQPTLILLPGKSHGQRSLVDWGPWGREESGLSDFTFTFHFHALEKEMATNSSVLAWRIPGTGEPGGLPSVGSHRVGHDWTDLAAARAW